ncbi:MAG TPA: type II secretion system F family protein [Candidatus Baltobacteraceae bacterium]
MTGQLFYYTARDVRGAFVRGSVEAVSDATALASLRTRALFVTSLERAGTARGTLVGALQFGSVKQAALVAFFRSFATLLSAGVAMRRSLEVTIEQGTDARLGEALRGILHDIEGGNTLSDAMARHPREFHRLYVAMVRAGEVGGVLDEVLEWLAAFLERDRSLRKRVAASLAYPAVVALTACSLVVFLLTSVVPMFENMYQQMHVALPPITSFLIHLGAALRSAKLWAAVGVVAISGLVCCTRFRKALASARALGAARLRVPVLGAIARKATLARMARMLGILLRSGVGLVAALDVVAGVVGNVIYEEHLALVGVALAHGDTLAAPLATSRLYDPLFVQMIRVGEETGALDSMLARVAEYYETDVEAALGALGSILEPVTIVLLGGIVGFIVSAIFIPLYTLIGNIK